LFFVVGVVCGVVVIAGFGIIIIHVVVAILFPIFDFDVAVSCFAVVIVVYCVVSVVTYVVVVVVAAYTITVVVV